MVASAFFSHNHMIWTHQKSSRPVRSLVPVLLQRNFDMSWMHSVNRCRP